MLAFSLLSIQSLLQPIAALRDAANTEFLSERLQKRSVPDQSKRIECELQKVLGSRTFHRSTRLKRMLKYVVGQYLAGKCHCLKEYTLAVEVFERNTSFEGGSDPIVRVQAMRLRYQLDRYYATEGAQDDLRLDLPKGTYIPAIVERIGLHSEARSSVAPSCKTVIVLPFSLSDETQIDGDGRVLPIADELIYQLTQYQHIRVLSRLSSSHLKALTDPHQMGQIFGAQFLVEGSISIQNNECLVITHLVETEHGYNIWASRYNARVDSLNTMTEQISIDIVRSLTTHK